MLFTFPSRYWYTIGLSDIFSLTGWSRQIHTGFHVSRATQDTPNAIWTYEYATFMLYGWTFQNILLHSYFVQRCPTTPRLPKQGWFGLFPVRSPLLRESLLFSFPTGTKMFQFPAYASLIKDNHSSNDWVVPFGNPGVKGHLHLNRAYRSLSRPSSPPRAKASTGRPSSLFFRSELYFQHCSTLLFWFFVKLFTLLYIT